MKITLCFFILFSAVALLATIMAASFTSATAIGIHNKKKHDFASSPIITSLRKSHQKSSNHDFEKNQQQQAASSIIKASSSAAAGMVQIVAKYMEADLNGVSFVLRGTAPLSWTAGQGIPMQKIATNTFAASFSTATIWGNLTNTSTWNFEFKIVAVGANNFEAWELGWNHRAAIQKGDDASRKPIIACPYFNTNSGSMTTVKNVFSPQLNNTRDVWIYIPAQVVENTVCGNGVNFILMHDGQNLQPLWNMNTHLDTQISEGNMGPALVFGPYNTGLNRIFEYTYSACNTLNCQEAGIGGQGGGGDLYLDFLENTLMPQLVPSFPTVDFSLRNRGMLGSSLGGSLSAYAGITRPSQWTTIVGMSSSFWWNDEDFLRTIVPKITPINPKTQKIYVDTGDKNGLDDDVFTTSAITTKMIMTWGGLQSEGKWELFQNFFINLDRNGIHNEASWSVRCPTVLSWVWGRNGLTGLNS